MQTSRHLRWSILALAGLVIPSTLGARAATAASEIQEQAASPTRPSLAPMFQQLDEPLQLHEPLQKSTTAVDDRVQATAWFCTGLLFQQRQENLAAYRAFQQAIQYDPVSTESYDALWRLAIELRQIDAGVRYLLKTVDLDTSKYADLFRLAELLTRAQDHERSLQLLEQARKSPELKESSPLYVSLMLQLGRLYEQKEQHEQAVQAYRVVRSALEDPARYGLDQNLLPKVIRPSVEAAYIEIGQALLEADQPQEALETFQKVEEIDPKREDLHYYRAQVYLEMNQLEKAHAELKQFLDGPSRFKGKQHYQLFADILAKLSRQSEFLPVLESAAEKSPQLRYPLADHYRQSGDLERAEKLYIALLAEMPKPEGYAGLAALYRQTKRPDELFAHFGRSWRENNNRLDVLNEELAALAKDKEFLPMLVNAARKQISEKPDDLHVGSIYALARLAAVAEDVEVAAEFYREALRRHSEESWHFELGLLYFGTKRYQEAADVFREAIDQAAGVSAMFHILRVRSLALAGNTELALQAAEKARQSAGSRNVPRLQAAIQSLPAWVYYYAQRWDEARKAYEALIETHWPNWTFGLAESEELNPLREAHFLLSNIYVELGDHPRSEELLLRILRDAPDDPHVNNDLGYLWADQAKNLDQAELMIRKAVQAEPNNPAYLDSLGWLFVKREQYDLALEQFQKATQLPEGSDPVIWDHLGDVYARLNQPEKAREAWQKSLELFSEGRRPDAKRVEIIKKKLSE